MSVRLYQVVLYLLLSSCNSILLGEGALYTWILASDTKPIVITPIIVSRNLGDCSISSPPWQSCCYYVSALCTPYLDAQFQNCTSAGPGQYIASLPIRGNSTTIGKDTLINECTQSHEGEYVGEKCDSGSLPLSDSSAYSYCRGWSTTGSIGSDAIIRTCGPFIPPQENEFVYSLCTPESAGINKVRIYHSLF